MSGRSEDLRGTGAADAAGSALVVRGLACARGDRSLFTGLDFSATAGAVVWIRGANGQGKTTLLRTLAGLASPAAGSVVRRGPAGALAPVYLAHANGVKEDLTAGESLAFLLRLAGAAASTATIDAALERFGVRSRREAPVRTLSQGQRRRVALARLAVGEAPALWLLDEPHDALDDEGSAALDDLLVAHAARGGIVVMTSHLPLAIAAPRPQVVQLGASSPPRPSGVDPLRP